MSLLAFVKINLMNVSAITRALVPSQKLWDSNKVIIINAIAIIIIFNNKPKIASLFVSTSSWSVLSLASLFTIKSHDVIQNSTVKCDPSMTLKFKNILTTTLFCIIIKPLLIQELIECFIYKHAQWHLRSLYFLKMFWKGRQKSYWLFWELWSWTFFGSMGDNFGIHLKK